MNLDERVSNVIKSIYAAGAGEDPTEWDSVGERVLQLVGGCAGLTTVVDLKDREFSCFRVYGGPRADLARAVEEYPETYKLDPSLLWASEHPDARFCDSSQTLSANEYLSNEFIKWNRARMNSTHWYVGYSSPTDKLSYSFSVHFPAEQGPGTTESIELFRMLFDQMECSIRLSRRPFNPESTRALLLLDGRGFVRELSNGAHLLLNTSGAFSVIGGRLSTADPQEQTRLDALLARVASTPKTGAGPAAIKLSHPLGHRPWIIAVQPVLSCFGPFEDIQCNLLIEVHDGIPKVGSLDLVQSLFDLTGRELQLLRLLADGHSVQSLATCMRISVNTARVHLRAIFAKTDTVRQSQLLQLCAGLHQPEAQD